jgi:hypothetical protein
VNRPSVTGAWRKAIEVLTALGERDATIIAATEQRAGVALQAMITDES